jgi:hypothetical protein
MFSEATASVEMKETARVNENIFFIINLPLNVLFFWKNWVQVDYRFIYEIG